MIMNNLFLISSQEISLMQIQEETLLLTSFWGMGLQVLFLKEFPFENLNIYALGNDLIFPEG